MSLPLSILLGGNMLIKKIKTYKVKAFTLIEMLVVLLIISVLLLLFVPNLTKQKDSVKETGNAAVVKVVESQAELYELNHTNDQATLAKLIADGNITNKQAESYRAYYAKNSGEININTKESVGMMVTNNSATIAKDKVTATNSGTINLAAGLSENDPNIGIYAKDVDTTVTNSKDIIGGKMIYYINALKTDDNTAGPKAPNDIYELTKEYNGKEIIFNPFPVNKGRLYQKAWLLSKGVMQWMKVFSSAKEGDVVVAISFSPYAAETVNISKVCARKGVKQISITDSQISPLLAFSDIAFVIKEAQVLGFRSQCSTMTLVQTLAIVLGLEKEKDKNTK